MHPLLHQSINCLTIPNLRVIYFVKQVWNKVALMSDKQDIQYFPFHPSADETGANLFDNSINQ